MFAKINAPTEEFGSPFYKLKLHKMKKGKNHTEIKQRLGRYYGSPAFDYGGGGSSSGDGCGRGWAVINKLQFFNFIFFNNW
ncbi:unnamed protein product [Cuscuta campestris]|uniref:Uncharacterized protein n=1 Tax=Cuscuta campestris TaxID=132261 RepID=A0A484LQA9_9ASTE|nr:unnamed protein product [Cuscuta campestris]